jgi:hypothetical protein
MKENSISRVIDGVTHIGKWSVENDIVTVRNAFGAGVKSTQLGGSPPEALALIMLAEMYREVPPCPGC